MISSNGTWVDAHVRLNVLLRKTRFIGLNTLEERVVFVWALLEAAGFVKCLLAHLYVNIIKKLSLWFQCVSVSLCQMLSEYLFHRRIDIWTFIIFFLFSCGVLFLLNRRRFVVFIISMLNYFADGLIIILPIQLVMSWRCLICEHLPFRLWFQWNFGVEMGVQDNLWVT